MGGRELDSKSLGDIRIDPLPHRLAAAHCADRIAARHPGLNGRQLAHDPDARAELLLLLDAIGYQQGAPVSMYSLAVGDGHQNERGAVLIAALGNPDVGRFRDAWVEKGDDGEPVIAIYTRNGGGNREGYADVIDCLQAHALYLRDADDDFDSTYATFYFRTPDHLRDTFREIASEPVNMSDVWQKAIAAIGSGGAK